MAKKLNVVSIGAVIDNRPVGSTFELDEQVALNFERLGYVRIFYPEPVEESPVKKESAPTKPEDDTQDDGEKPARKPRKK